MTPAAFEAMWAALAAATVEQHPDTNLADWLRHDARGLIVHPSCDQADPHSGRIEWIA